MTRSMHPGMLLGGRYRLDDLLSDIDGARFWRATDTLLARSVAVHAIASDDPRAETLLSAARSAAALNEPHLLRILDCDLTDSLAWVVNEWGTGVSLDVMVAADVLPPERAVWFVGEVAEAITAVHARGLAHGRLCPENVLLTHTGAVKLIGFAVDAALHRPREAESGNYPGADPMQRDVRDLGGLLYCALVGAWAGASASDVRPAPRNGRDPMRARQVRAGIPRELDSLCDRVLSTHRTHDRIGSAHEFASLLGAYAGTEVLGAPIQLAEPEDTQPIPQLPPWPSEPDPVPASPSVVHEPRPVTPPPVTPPPSTPPPVTPPPITQSPIEDPEATQGVGSERFDDDPVPERPVFAPHGARRTPKPGVPLTPAPVIEREEEVSRPPAPLHEPDDSGWPFAEAPVAPTHPDRPWLRWPLIVGLVVALLIGALTWGAATHRLPGQEPVTPQTTPAQPVVPQRVPIVAAQDFDPEATPPEENPDQVGKAIDGDPNTGWTTLTYKRRPDLGGLKSGVGLILDLGEIHRVSRVEVSFATAPTNLTLYAVPTDGDLPTSLTGLTKVASATDAATQLSLRLKRPIRTRYLVVWLTSLPPAPGGFRGEITDVAVWS